MGFEFPSDWSLTRRTHTASWSGSEAGDGNLSGLTLHGDQQIFDCGRRDREIVGTIDRRLMYQRRVVLSLPWPNQATSSPSGTFCSDIQVASVWRIV